MRNCIIGVSLLCTMLYVAGGFVLPERLTGEDLVNIIGAGPEQTDCLPTGGPNCPVKNKPIGGANAPCPDGVGEKQVCFPDESWCNDATEDNICQYKSSVWNWYDCKPKSDHICKEGL